MQKPVRIKIFISVLWICIICHTPEKLMVKKRKELLYQQRPLMVKQLPHLLHWLFNIHLLDYCYVYVRQLWNESHSCVYTMRGADAVPFKLHLLWRTVTRGGALWACRPYWSTCSIQQPMSEQQAQQACLETVQGSNINIHLWCHNQMFWVKGDVRRYSSFVSPWQQLH